MIPRPLACDGDDCQDDGHRWQHQPGCHSLTDEPDTGGWPDAYLDGYGPRTPRTRKAHA